MSDRLRYADVWRRLDAWEAYFRANPETPIRKRMTVAELDKLAQGRDVQTTFRLAGKALDGSGEYRGPCTVVWDIAGKCAMPATVLYKKRGVAMAVEMTVPCRTGCEHCLRKRRVLWTGRAKEELRLATRSWFGTLTLSPDHHYRVLCQAEALARKACVDFTAMQPGDQLRYRHKVIGVELQRWLKRVRKVSGAPLRYCLVMEAHASGLPHYHVLVHQSSDVPVLYDHLCDSWHWGFTKFNLVHQDEDAPAFYVCKYLSKSALARVRASGRYGERRSNAIVSRRNVRTRPPNARSGSTQAAEPPNLAIGGTDL